VTAYLTTLTRLGILEGEAGIRAQSGASKADRGTLALTAGEKG